MKKRFVTLALVLALLVALVIPASVAMAATTGTVGCTVTGELISVTVTDGDVAYGVLAMGATEDTTTTGLGDVQTATNDGSGIEDFNIMSSDATGGTGWTLAGTAGADAFTHKVSLDDGTSWSIVMTGSYQSLATGIGAAGTQDFDLQIGMPASATDYTQKTITVTVQAVDGS